MSDVILYCKNSAGTILQTYNLSPGCKVSHQVQKDNILAAIPFLGQLGIDMGLITQNLVTVTGQMFQTHNNRLPIVVMEEIENIATYSNTTNNEVQIFDGKWDIRIGTSATYSGIPYIINYDIAAGEGDIVNYTIQLNVST